MRTHPRLRVAGKAKTYGGVDVAGRSKAELLDLARRLGVKVRSNMTKDELGDAIAAANRRATTETREREREERRRDGPRPSAP